MTKEGFRNFARVKNWTPAPGSPHNNDYFGGDYSHRKDEDYWLRAGLVDSDFTVMHDDKIWSMGHIPADAKLNRKAGFRDPGVFNYDIGNGFAIITVKKKIPYLVLYPEEARFLTDSMIAKHVPSLKKAEAKRQTQTKFLGRGGGAILGRPEFNLLTSLTSPRSTSHGILPIPGYTSWTPCPIDSNFIIEPATGLRFYKKSLTTAITTRMNAYSIHFKG